MNTTTHPAPPDVDDLLALADRLDVLRQAPPQPLPRHYSRDGPHRDTGPCRPPNATTGHTALHRPIPGTGNRKELDDAHHHEQTG